MLLPLLKSRCIRKTGAHKAWYDQNPIVGQHRAQIQILFASTLKVIGAFSPLTGIGIFLSQYGAERITETETGSLLLRTHVDHQGPSVGEELLAVRCFRRFDYNLRGHVVEECDHPRLLQILA